MLSDLDRFSDSHNSLLCTVAFFFCDRMTFIACMGVSKVAKASGGVMSNKGTPLNFHLLVPMSSAHHSSTNDSISSMALSTNLSPNHCSLGAGTRLAAGGGLSPFKIVFCSFFSKLLLWKDTNFFLGNRLTNCPTICLQKPSPGKTIKTNSLKMY